MAPGWMGEAFLVKVKTEVRAGADPAISLWVAVTGTADEAVAAVKKRVAANCKVELTEPRISPLTVKRLGLTPGQIWHL